MPDKLPFKVSMLLAAFSVFYPVLAQMSIRTGFIIDSNADYMLHFP
ncbi:hypothetical protein ACFLXO_06765 [Chloroflexota bacterium]